MSVRDQAKHRVQVRANWQRPSLDQTAEHVSRKLGIPVSKVKVAAAERSALEKIRRVLVASLHDRRTA